MVTVESEAKLISVLNSVLSYDREAIEDRLKRLGHGVEREAKVKVDDIGCFQRKHPNVAVIAEFRKGWLVRFRPERR